MSFVLVSSQPPVMRSHNNPWDLYCHGITEWSGVLGNIEDQAVPTRTPSGFGRFELHQATQCPIQPGLGHLFPILFFFFPNEVDCCSLEVQE